jgi:hypothetical protein
MTREAMRQVCLYIVRDVERLLKNPDELRRVNDDELARMRKALDIILRIRSESEMRFRKELDARK